MAPVKIQDTILIPRLVHIEHLTMHNQDYGHRSTPPVPDDRANSKSCIYSRRTFVSASGEHILQNSFGARWRSTRIVCDDVQQEFGRTIDAEIDQHFRVLRSLLNVESGRKDPAPTIKGLKTQDGLQTVDIEPGGRPRLNRPNVIVKPLPDGRHEIHFQLGTKDHLGWAIHELKKQFPDVSVDAKELVKTASRAKSYVDSPVCLQFSFGGQDYARAIAKSCFNLLAVSKHSVLDPAFDKVREFVLRGTGSSEEFLRWPIEENTARIPSLGKLDHFLGFVSRGSTVEGLVKLFGCVYQAVRLTTTYEGPPLRCAYLVDPLREALVPEVRQPDFQEGIVPFFAEFPEYPEAKARMVLKAGVTHLMDEFYSRSRADTVDAVLKEVLGRPDGQPITREQINKISHLLARRILRLPDDY